MAKNNNHKRQKVVKPILSEFAKRCIKNNCDKANSLHGRIGSILRAGAGSISCKLTPKEYNERIEYVHQNIDITRCFFTNRQDVKLTNDHLFALIDSRQWTGFYPDDPMNQVSCGVKCNNKKGNKDPIKFLYQKWESLGLTEQERDEKIAYICSICWESPVEYVYLNHKSLGIEDNDILSSIIFELFEIRSKAGDIPLIHKASSDVINKKNSILENMYMLIEHFESELNQ